MARALDDVCIVDLTRVIAGPFVTTLLADMGAMVIKIDCPGAATTPATATPPLRECRWRSWR
jgi:crotonobetainyl-CoA:carnitine CoA-transferase CaiB-like acyl-CoA transferase